MFVTKVAERIEARRLREVEGESIKVIAARVGAAAFEERVRDLAMPVEFGLQSMNTFIDWTKDVPFQVVRGEGECAV